MKKIILFTMLVLLVGMIIPEAVHADIIDPGKKGVDWCYKIDNMQDYQEYEWGHYNSLIGVASINQGECFKFSKMGEVSIYAIKKTEIGENQLDYYFITQNKDNLAMANTQLTAYGVVDEDDPLTKAETTLHINLLEGTKLDIQKTKVSYTYSDGTSEEKAFNLNGNTSGPSRSDDSNRSNDSNKLYFIIPVLAILIIGVIFLPRKLKK